MEIRDGFMQGRRRIIRQQPLEITKGQRAVIEILRLLNDIEAGCILYKYVGSPNRNIFLLFYDWQITIDKHPYGIFLSTELRNSTSNKTQRKAAKANQ